MVNCNVIWEAWKSCKRTQINIFENDFFSKPQETEPTKVALPYSQSRKMCIPKRDGERDRERFRKAFQMVKLRSIFPPPLWRGEGGGAEGEGRRRPSLIHCYNPCQSKITQDEMFAPGWDCSIFLFYFFIFHFYFYRRFSAADIRFSPPHSLSFAVIYWLFSAVFFSFLYGIYFCVLYWNKAGLAWYIF